MSNFFYFKRSNLLMPVNDSKDFVDVIEQWALLIGVRLDSDPEQIV